MTSTLMVLLTLKYMNKMSLKSKYGLRMNGTFKIEKMVKSVS